MTATFLLVTATNAAAEELQRTKHLVGNRPFLVTRISREYCEQSVNLVWIRPDTAARSDSDDDISATGQLIPLLPFMKLRKEAGGYEFVLDIQSIPPINIPVKLAIDDKLVVMVRHWLQLGIGVEKEAQWSVLVGRKRLRATHDLLTDDGRYIFSWRPLIFLAGLRGPEEATALSGQEVPDLTVLLEHVAEYEKDLRRAYPDLSLPSVFGVERARRSVRGSKVPQSREPHVETTSTAADFSQLETARVIWIYSPGPEEKPFAETVRNCLDYTMSSLVIISTRELLGQAARLAEEPTRLTPLVVAEAGDLVFSHGLGHLEVLGLLVAFRRRGVLVVDYSPSDPEWRKRVLSVLLAKEGKSSASDTRLALLSYAEAVRNADMASRVRRVIHRYLNDLAATRLDIDTLRVSAGAVSPGSLVQHMQDMWDGWRVDPGSHPLQALVNLQAALFGFADGLPKGFAGQAKELQTSELLELSRDLATIRHPVIREQMQTLATLCCLRRNHGSLSLAASDEAWTFLLQLADLARRLSMVRGRAESSVAEALAFFRSSSSDFSDSVTAFSFGEWLESLAVGLEDLFESLSIVTEVPT